MKFIIACSLLFPNLNIAAQKECIKSVYVKANIKEFVVSLPFPKILNYAETDTISIKCELYQKINIGDILYADDIKEFILLDSSALPHGTIKRIHYEILKK